MGFQPDHAALNERLSAQYDYDNNVPRSPFRSRPDSTMLLVVMADVLSRNSVKYTYLNVK